MPIRLIPATDSSEFPYAVASSMLRDMEGMAISDVDFPAMIEAGKRFGWPQKTIDSHWGMMERGKCFQFAQSDAPFLQGTMYEDNIFFSFQDRAHQELCESIINSMAKLLGVRTILR
jgi:hypothetical protein